MVRHHFALTASGRSAQRFSTLLEQTTEHRPEKTRTAFQSLVFQPVVLQETTTDHTSCSGLSAQFRVYNHPQPKFSGSATCTSSPPSNTACLGMEHWNEPPRPYRKRCKVLSNLRLMLLLD